MKKICLTLIALCMNFNLSADEIPLENVITINNPTHLGVAFVALSPDEVDDYEAVYRNSLVLSRAKNICKFMGHGAPTGSVIEIEPGRVQLLWLDDNLNAIPNIYGYLYSYDRTRTARKFSKISCTRLTKKDAVKEAEATKEKLQKLLAEIEDLEKKIKSANQRVNQSARSSASEKKESDVKQNTTNNSAKRM